jgi:hypothetical protein
VAIIDNAMYEQPDAIDFEKLIDIALTLTTNSTFIVAPEHLTNPNKTIDLAIETARNYGTKGPGWEMMVVVHGAVSAELIFQMSKLHTRGINAFGIVVSYWRGGNSRADILKEFHPKFTYMHALGLDDIDEIQKLRNAGYDSVDSSIVASAAVNYISLRQERKIIRNGSPFDPKRVDLLQTHFGSNIYRETHRNVRLVKELCEG